MDITATLLLITTPTKLGSAKISLTVLEIHQP